MAKTTILNFTTVGDYCKVKPSETNRAAFDEMAKRNMAGEKSERWIGTKTMAEAEKILSTGWAEGVKKAKDAMGKIKIPGEIKCVRRKLKMSETGDEVDYEKMMAGDQRCYKTYSYEPGFTTGEDKSIRICVDTDACGYVSAEEMFWKGATAAVLADELEQQGRNVEIVAYFYSSGHSAINPQDRLFVNCILKKEGEPLDLNRIMALTGHAASLRILGFRTIASLEDEVHYSWGRPVMFVDTKSWPEIPGTEGIPMVHITNIWSKQASMNWLADFCKAQDKDGKDIPYVDEPPPPKNLESEHVLGDVIDEMNANEDGDDEWLT